MVYNVSNINTATLSYKRHVKKSQGYSDEFAFNRFDLSRTQGLWRMRCPGQFTRAGQGPEDVRTPTISLSDKLEIVGLFGGLKKKNSAPPLCSDALSLLRKKWNLQP